MKKIKILIVDNDEDEQFFMKEGFNATGLYDIVGQPENGDDLFEWLEQHTNNLPDVILSDLNMHGKNGYDILDEINTMEAFRHIPVIITSTSLLPSVSEKCIALGAVAYIPKPETFNEYKPFAEALFQFLKEKQVVK